MDGNEKFQRKEAQSYLQPISVAFLSLDQNVTLKIVWFSTKISELQKRT